MVQEPALVLIVRLSTCFSVFASFHDARYGVLYQ